MIIELTGNAIEINFDEDIVGLNTVIDEFQLSKK